MYYLPFVFCQTVLLIFLAPAKTVGVPNQTTIFINVMVFSQVLYYFVANCRKKNYILLYCNMICLKSIDFFMKYA